MEQAAYTAAGEWASALSRETGFKVALRVPGGMGLRQGFQLRRTRCNVFSWPQIPFHGHLRGIDFSRIAHITNDQQRVGATLLREARNSNNVLLAILLYWQILEIRTSNPVGSTNKVIVRHPRHRHRAREYLPHLNLIAVYGRVRRHHARADSFSP